MRDDDAGSRTTDRKPQLAVERTRNRVTLEIYCADDYAAMLLYESIVTSAAQIGELSLSVELDIVDG